MRTWSGIGIISTMRSTRLWACRLGVGWSRVRVRGSSNSVSRAWGCVGVRPDRTIWKLIGIILQGINIAKASMGQETFNGLSGLGHHEMNFQSIKIPFLTGLIASKMFIGVHL